MSMPPDADRNARAIGLAVVAALTALSSAFAAASALRRAARRESHALPAEESWFEPTAAPRPEQVQRGRRLYLDNCAHCHGVDATGDEGPDLHGVQMSDRYIARLITHGLPHEMPGFAHKLDPGDVGTLIVYVRSLNEPAGPGRKQY